MLEVNLRQGVAWGEAKKTHCTGGISGCSGLQRDLALPFSG